MEVFYPTWPHFQCNHLFNQSFTNNANDLGKTFHFFAFMSANATVRTTENSHMDKLEKKTDETSVLVPSQCQQQSRFGHCCIEMNEE